MVQSDPLCAGDCFVAGLVAGLLDGRDLADAVRWGQAVAAAKVTRFGELATTDEALYVMRSAGEKQ